MNLTVLENRLADFNNTMKSVADDLHHFRDLLDKKLAEEEGREEERKYMREAERKRDIARCFIAHKGDGFTVCDDFTLPAAKEGVDPAEGQTADIVKQGERLTVEKVDCLSSNYDPIVTIFRNDCGISFTLTLDKIQKLIMNDILMIIGKNAA